MTKNFTGDQNLIPIIYSKYIHEVLVKVNQMHSSASFKNTIFMYMEETNFGWQCILTFTVVKLVGKLWVIWIPQDGIFPAVLISNRTPKEATNRHWAEL